MPPKDIMNTLQVSGIIGAVPGVIGVIQAMEVLKLILGEGDVLKKRLLIYDALKTKFRRVKVPRNPECAVCGDNPTITELKDYETNPS